MTTYNALNYAFSARCAGRVALNDAAARSAASQASLDAARAAAHSADYWAGECERYATKAAPCSSTT